MGQLVISIALRGNRPKKEDYESEYISPRMWELFEKCWEAEPTDRPSIDEIIRVLNVELGLPIEMGLDGDTVMTEEPVASDADYPAAF